MRLGTLDLNQLYPETPQQVAGAAAIFCTTGIAFDALGATPFQSFATATAALATGWLWRQLTTRWQRDNCLLSTDLPVLTPVDNTTTNHITETLADYGIPNTRIVGTKPGAVLIRHLLKIPTGTKLGKLPLEDMARDLGVSSVNIEPNAGRGLIGIDIPRPDRQYPKLPDLLASKEWQERSPDMLLPCCPAVDQFGNSLVFDLASTPHLIVAGTTGSGKSVAANAILLSLIASGADFRLMIADGKGEDFADRYQHSRYLINPADLPKDAEAPPAAVAKEIPAMRDQVLWLTQEMDRRLATGDKPFPIIFVCDELADIVMQDDKDKTITKALARIAQKARSAKIHMILITQYPTADVVHPLIAVNTPSRLGLLVDKDHQSRVVIGDNGCEELLGKGDALLKIAGLGIRRIHAVDIKDADFKNI